MLNDQQLASINSVRQKAGKRPIDTQTARQNPTLPVGVDWLKFWTDYEMRGDPPADAKNPPPTLPRDTFAAGVDGKDHGIIDPQSGESNAGQDDEDEETYEDMTIAELRAEAEKRELDHAGVNLKSEWVKLLEDDDAKKG